MNDAHAMSESRPPQRMSVSSLIGPKCASWSKVVSRLVTSGALRADDPRSGLDQHEVERISRFKPSEISHESAIRMAHAAIFVRSMDGDAARRLRPLAAVGIKISSSHSMFRNDADRVSAISESSERLALGILFIDPSAKTGHSLLALAAGAATGQAFRERHRGFKNSISQIAGALGEPFAEVAAELRAAGRIDPSDPRIVLPRHSLETVADVSHRGYLGASMQFIHAQAKAGAPQGYLEQEKRDIALGLKSITSLRRGTMEAEEDSRPGKTAQAVAQLSENLGLARARMGGDGIAAAQVLFSVSAKACAMATLQRSRMAEREGGGAGSDQKKRPDRGRVM